MKKREQKHSSSLKTAMGIIHGMIKHLFSEIQVKKRKIQKVIRQLSIRSHVNVSFITQDTAQSPKHAEISLHPEHWYRNKRPVSR